MTTPKLDQLLLGAADSEASDLHLVVGVPPAYRVNGEIILADSDALTGEENSEMIDRLLNDHQRRKFDEDWELCVSIRHPDAGRIRATF